MDWALINNFAAPRKDEDSRVFGFDAKVARGRAGEGEGRTRATRPRSCAAGDVARVIRAISDQPPAR